MRLAGFFASVVRYFRGRSSQPPSRFIRVVDRPEVQQPALTLISTFLLNSPNSENYSITDGIVRPDRNIPLDDALKLTDLEPIWANRGKAIQCYAILEQSLSHLLANLGGMDLETAGTIFYKITNTGSRTSILERLLRKRHGSKFNVFWNVYFKELRQIDLRRNQIVHWLSAMSTAMSDHNVILVGISLIPPGYREGGPPEHLRSKDLMEFATKCDVFGRLCNMFVAATSDAETMGDAAKTWLDIFQQPLVYPLQAGHPLLGQTPPKPDTQPPPSPA
jgi:hypothetical protein